VENNYPVDKEVDNCLEIRDGDVISIPDEHSAESHSSDLTLQAIFTPGHAKDHMSFYFKKENSMFVGDNILGNSSTVVEDLKSYLASLKIMQSTKANILYTGHGQLENYETFQKYINHRLNREKQILDYFKKCGKDQVLSPDKFVDAIYIPEGLDQKLYMPACGNVLTCLTKLCVEGVVARRVDCGPYHFELK